MTGDLNPVPDSHFDVLIVGGGFSGAMLAVHLLRSTSLSVAIIDRGVLPGRGLAYGTPHRFHLLNVPADRMSALPDEADHFLRWARTNFDASVQPRSFLPRAIYGQYVGSLLERSVSERGPNRFRWIQDEALSLRRRQGYRAVQRKNGPELFARGVVLATGNFPPADPKIAGLKLTSSRYFSFAWANDALEGLPTEGRVLLVGSGLTAVDMIMALKSKGFQGKIHVLSRRGLLPHRSKQTGTWPLFWNERSPRTARGLLRLIRGQAEAASAEGIDWRSVIDCLRPVTQEIWRSLPVEEQKRFLRHARSYWDVHRHRVAPEIADVLSDMMAEGHVLVHRGRITRYREGRGVAEITYRERGGAGKRLRVHRVINCTGSETDCRRIDDPLITSLFVQGFARPDPLFLGLEVDEHGALVDYMGIPSRSLFAIGPTRKGCLWETTAVPEIRQQAWALAGHLAPMLEKGRRRISQEFEAAV
jgi:uncharacterized NAD(P)/FAD-binding protein YdhS